MGTAKGSHTVTGERLVCVSDTSGQFVVRAAAPLNSSSPCNHQDSGKLMSGADMSTQLGLPSGQASPASSRMTGFASPCMNLPSAPFGELYSGGLQQLCVNIGQQHARSLHAGEGMSLGCG